MTRQVQQAISGDPQLTQVACWCLGSPDTANISGLCLCSDQLSDPSSPWDISSDVLKDLGNWWKRCVAVSGPDSHMTYDLYKTLVARFYCPMTTVAVPCTSPHACMSSPWIVNSQETGVVPCGRPHLLQYDFLSQKDVEKAVTRLSKAARGGALYVIADQPVPVWPGTFCRSDAFQTFCDKLQKQVPRLHLWAASCYHRDAPAGWQVEYLTRSLRSPPTVVREVQQDRAITVTRKVLAYSEPGVSDHTDGPPVRQLYHKGQGHSGDGPHTCVTCGREVASVLHSLRVSVPVDVSTTSTPVTTTSGGTTPPCLQWRDVLVLSCYDISDESGVLTGLREAGIPVRVMKDNDIVDVATARSDVVWVAGTGGVRGLERKVVVRLDGDFNRYSVRFELMSRCTSQLVIVSR